MLRRVSDPWRAKLVFGVTGISNDLYRSTMGVNVICLRTPRSAGENFGCIWENLRVPATSLGELTTRIGAPGSVSGQPGSTWKCQR
jgi:hypothetical protein